MNKNTPTWFIIVPLLFLSILLLTACERPEFPELSEMPLYLNTTDPNMTAGCLNHTANYSTPYLFNCSIVGNLNQTTHLGPANVTLLWTNQTIYHQIGNKFYFPTGLYIFGFNAANGTLIMGSLSFNLSPEYKFIIPAPGNQTGFILANFSNSTSINFEGLINASDYFNFYALKLVGKLNMTNLSLPINQTMNVTNSSNSSHSANTNSNSKSGSGGGCGLGCTAMRRPGGSWGNTNYSFSPRIKVSTTYVKQNSTLNTSPDPIILPPLIDNNTINESNNVTAKNESDIVEGVRFDNSTGQVSVTLPKQKGSPWWFLIIIVCVILLLGGLVYAARQRMKENENDEDMTADQFSTYKYQQRGKK